jgi:hypothetical protein
MPKPLFDDIRDQFSALVRDPKSSGMACDVSLYHELVVNNLAEILQDCFPVLLSILKHELWYALVQSFLCEYASKSALFYEVPSEFVKYLTKQKIDRLPYPFVAELAHYEWIELAVEILEDPKPAPCHSYISMEKRLSTSELACLCRYTYPVHRIGVQYLPSKPPIEPTWMLVYRNAEDVVEFIHCNRASARLWQLIDTHTINGYQAIAMFKKEMPASHASIQENAEHLLMRWGALGLLTVKEHEEKRYVAKDEAIL